jgi:hypothetical protein
MVFPVALIVTIQMNRFYLEYFVGESEKILEIFVPG